MISDSYIDELPSEPLLALMEIIQKVKKIYVDLGESQRYKELDCFLEAFAIINLLQERVGISSILPPELVGEPREMVKAIYNFSTILDTAVNEEVAQLKLATFEQKYSARFSTGFHYEFTDGDIDKIQNLINDLRNMISSSSLFEDEHKARLLARLEKLQNEIHKKMADVDRFWGLIGDAGIAIGKFGTEAKPFVDRIKEISDIVWRTQSRAEELPSDTPMSLLEQKEPDS